MRKIVVITLFPEMFDGVLNSSMMWKAQKDGLIAFDLVNLRNFGLGTHQKVDDTVYGGGDGMLLMIEPLVAALEHARRLVRKGAKVLLMSPSEHVWSHEDASEHAARDEDLIIICGRYEGVDARLEAFIDEKISIGKFVLTGGEIPAMAVIDSIVRLIPGVLGGAESATIESYTEGDNLEFPQYTRPEEFAGMKVPEVLLSGNHAEIAKWRTENRK